MGKPILLLVLALLVSPTILVFNASGLAIRDWLIVLGYDGNVTDLAIVGDTIYATGVLVNGSTRRGFLLEILWNGSINRTLLFGNGTVTSTALTVAGNKLYLAWSEVTSINNTTLGVAVLGVVDPATLEIRNTTALPLPEIRVQSLLGATTFYGQVAGVVVLENNDVSILVLHPRNVNNNVVYYTRSYVYSSTLNPRANLSCWTITYAGRTICVYSDYPIALGRVFVTGGPSVYLVNPNTYALRGGVVFSAPPLSSLRETLWFGYIYMPQYPYLYRVENTSLIVLYDYGYFKLVGFQDKNYIVGGDTMGYLNNTFPQVLVVGGDGRAVIGGRIVVNSGSYLFIARVSPLTLEYSAVYVDVEKKTRFTWTKSILRGLALNGTVDTQGATEIPLPTSFSSSSVSVSYKQVLLEPIIFAVAEAGGLGGVVEQGNTVLLTTLTIALALYLALRILVAGNH